jgi:hypothetical protein
MPRQKLPKSPKSAVDAPPPSKGKSRRQPRRKELWSVSENAIDTDEAIGLNQQAARLLANAVPGWSRMQAEAEQALQIDISPLCREFDSENRGYLPRGVVHLWLEPVIAHFTQHACWREPAQEAVCGYARSLYVLGSALDHERFEAWRAPPLRTINGLRAQSQQAMVRLVQETDALREAFNREHQAPVQQSRLLRKLERHHEWHRRYVDFCDNTIRAHAGAAHLLADPGDARPGLVFGEAELLAVPSITTRRVSELIIDLRENKSDGRVLVEGRKRESTTNFGSRSCDETSAKSASRDGGSASARRSSALGECSVLREAHPAQALLNSRGCCTRLPANRPNNPGSEVENGVEPAPDCRLTGESDSAAPHPFHRAAPNAHGCPDRLDLGTRCCARASRVRVDGPSLASRWPTAKHPARSPSPRAARGRGGADGVAVGTRPYGSGLGLSRRRWRRRGSPWKEPRDAADSCRRGRRSLAS